MKPRLQQYLPFTVLKHYYIVILVTINETKVATVPTVYGIETRSIDDIVYNAESVATVLTACGIETILDFFHFIQRCKLQQCLPLMVCDIWLSIIKIELL